MCCAGCGVKEDDDITLKKCTACYLVKYCSVKCQREHRPQHKRACKKRAAELRDEILFKQPESSHHGDCPICCLPLPVDQEKMMMKACCCKFICDGCDLANWQREEEGKLEHKCPFCRQPEMDDEAEVKNYMKRIEANDPFAMYQMSVICTEEGDFKSAVDYMSRSAALGNADAHYNLSHFYHEGQGVNVDKKKVLYHLEEAAICGHPLARHNLAMLEGRNGREDRGYKHMIIAANMGFDLSLACLKDEYKHGLVSNEVLASAIRGYQAAVNATKSPKREEAEAQKRRNRES